MFRFENVKLKSILEIEELLINDGEITCVLGESGSGKTTFLKLFNKIVSCDSGDIFYNEENIKKINSVKLRREVVMLSQTPVIFHGNIKENLLKGLMFSEKSNVSDEELIRILKYVNLNKDLYDETASLSGGEKQRLALGRVILMDPKVLLLDEPSSALDEGNESLIMERLVEYTKENNKTMLIVTHSKRLAYNYSDRVLQIENGKFRDLKTK